VGIIEEVFAAQAKPPRNCKVIDLVDQMDKQTAKEYLEALDNPKVQTEVLQRVLNDHGYAISTSTLGLHRRKGCSCVAK
jgi:hypothetical protein